MDIIPIIPAPQQGPPTPSVDTPAGNGDTGFDTILNQEMPNQATSIVENSPSETWKQQSSKAPLNSEEQPMAEDSDAMPGEGSGQLFDFPSSQNSAASLHDTSQVETIVSDQLEKIDLAADPFAQHYSLFRQSATGIDVSDTFSIPGNREIPTNQSLRDLPADKLPENLLDPFVTLTDIVDRLLSPEQLRPSELAGISNDNSSPYPRFSLELQSTASAFSIKSGDAAAITISAQSAFIDVNIEMGSATPLSTQGNISQSVPVNLLQADAHSQLRTISDFINISLPERAGAFFDTPHTSAFMNNQPGTAPAGQQPNIGSSSILLQELQKLLTNSEDSISLEVPFEPKVTSSKEIGYLFRPAILENYEARMSAAETSTRVSNNSLFEALLVDPGVSTHSKADPLRTSISEKANEQLLNPKFDLLGKNVEQNTNSQTSQQNLNSSNNNSLQQQAATTTQPVSALSTDQTTINTPFTSQFHDAGTAQGAETAKTSPTPLPQHTFVRDQEIINQLVERFTAQTRLQTSRLSMQLHPAELGQVKIDMIVKGDVLKANIYAQTHQAGELIDRNIHRLREILQDQGITVDDLVVSFQSDSIDDYSSQHGQLYQDQTPFLKQSHKSATTKFEIEEAVVENENLQSGVNLTI